MNNMKQKLVNKMKAKMVKSISEIALQTGESIGNRGCVGFVYEPKVPMAVLMEAVEKK